MSPPGPLWARLVRLGFLRPNEDPELARTRLTLLFGSVQHTTRVNYWRGLDRFTDYLETERGELVGAAIRSDSPPRQLDLLLCDYFAFAHQRELTFTPSHTRAAVQCAFGLARGALTGAVRMQTTIERLRERVRTIPITSNILVAGLANVEDDREGRILQASLVLMYALACRPGELFALRVSDVELTNTGVIITVRVTKNLDALRAGGFLAVDEDGFRTPVNGRLERRAVEHLLDDRSDGGAPLVLMTPRRFRQLFGCAFAFLEDNTTAASPLHRVSARPHGVRVGAVTDAATRGVDVEGRRALGRWASHTSALFYSNVQLAETVTSSRLSADRLAAGRRALAWLGKPVSESNTTEVENVSAADLPSSCPTGMTEEEEGSDVEEEDDDDGSSEELYDVDELLDIKLVAKKPTVLVSWTGFTTPTWHHAADFTGTLAWTTFKETEKFRSFSARHRRLMDKLE